MSESKKIQAGDPCPICGGAFHVDPHQHPDTLIDRKKRNAANPYAAARYAEQVQAKAEEFGLIHKCDRCGYLSRFKPAAKPAVAAPAASVGPAPAPAPVVSPAA